MCSASWERPMLRRSRNVRNFSAMAYGLIDSVTTLRSVEFLDDFFRFGRFDSCWRAVRIPVALLLTINLVYFTANCADHHSLLFSAGLRWLKQIARCHDSDTEDKKSNYVNV